MLLRRADIFHALVVLWAFLGIILKRVRGGGAEAQPIIICTAVCMAAVFVLGVIRARKYVSY